MAVVMKAKVIAKTELTLVMVIFLMDGMPEQWRSELSDPEALYEVRPGKVNTGIHTSAQALMFGDGVL
jgi:hypothetical protein